MDISSLNSAQILADAINESTSLSPACASAVARTLSILAGSEPAFAKSGLLNFEPKSLSLFPAQKVLPDDDTKEFLFQLAHAAQEAATSLSCGSLLAGQTSDSDDFGDIAVWLGEGDFGKGHESEVLRALGLDTTNHSGDNLAQTSSDIRLSPPKMLPETVNIQATGSECDKVVDLLSKLAEKYCFSVRSRSEDETVIIFLLGRIQGSNYWAGLVGAGLWMS